MRDRDYRGTHMSMVDSAVRIKHIAPSRVQRRKPVRWGRVLFNLLGLGSMGFVLVLLAHAIVSNS